MTNKIKLNQLSKTELEARQMNALRGGNQTHEQTPLIVSESACVCAGSTLPKADYPYDTTANTNTLTISYDK